jgi:hypothetical protein
MDRKMRREIARREYGRSNGQNEERERERITW